MQKGEGTQLHKRKETMDKELNLQRTKIIQEKLKELHYILAEGFYIVEKYNSDDAIMALQEEKSFEHAWCLVEEIRNLIWNVEKDIKKE